ncbi:MAG: hypothetical protein M1457_03600 [bacterium]|nr:hypothetical protein [bacterium]
MNHEPVKQSTQTLDAEAGLSGECALGIDGGAGQLKWAMRGSGGDRHVGRMPGANLQMLGWEEYQARLMAAVMDALIESGVVRSALVSLGLGLSGVDRPRERERLRDWVRANFPQVRHWWIGNDAAPVLRLGAGRLEGIALIAGTGSFCLGMTADGRRVRVGGWGGIIGDEGSAYWIGQHALRMATQMADGRMEPSHLRETILQALGLGSYDELIPYMAGRRHDELKRIVAALAPRIVDHARDGEVACQRLIDQAIGHLGNHVFSVARQLDCLERETETAPTRGGGLTPPAGEPALRPRTLVCAGGMFEHSDWIYERFRERIAHGGPFTVVRLDQPSALGALILGEENRDPA